MKTCDLCGHSMENNSHGFDQSDAWVDGLKLVHSGHCTYCHVCNPRLKELRGHPGWTGLVREIERNGIKIKGLR